MWIYLNDAFLSIVADRDDETRLLVRGRFASDIERIWPEAEVLQNAGADYRFRAFLPREMVVEAIANRLANVNYANFKGSVQEEWREDIYFEVWNKMYRAQETVGPTLIMGFRTP